MASNNIKILIWFYKTKLNRNLQAPIYLRVSFSGNRKEFSTGYSIEPNKWDAAKMKVKGKDGEAEAINSYLQQTQSKLVSLYNDMMKEGDVNLDKLVDRFFGRDHTPMTLLELVKYHNEDFKKRIGIDYTFSTYEKYDILRKKLEVFIPLKYGKQDMRIRDLSFQFAADFDFYLKEHDKNKHNTVVKYITNLKKILNMAVTNGWIDKSPFIKFKSTFKDVERIYLTQEELDAIEQKTFKIERLNLVRDMFLFQCYTGLAYSDMSLLTHADVKLGIDGNKWIIINRKKTDVRSAIPLLPKALLFIEKYDGKRNGDELQPCYSIQKFNSYLEEIADLCGIQKNLTSHVGRRTFVTTVALSNGVSIETISKILGHSTTKITHQYAVVTDLKVSQEMEKLKGMIKEKGAG
jgi:site-specific recombinase XerD